ncbi:hypothetical protein BJ508DRAFT_321778 [Ascobolus immersus RN42]|uniref:BAH domain-containing protein n=1 Tax=Ascobolus immersus RN42 TaxID=1160509 RepID=A0A3N4IR03_ASCIM|nr:hypothetical protein BJ508DRAFT_321778 [Ascobolus immersus RN42]
MFVWKNNHGISDQALTDLFEIVSQKWFDSSHLPRSATTLKNMRDQLPLPIIMSEKVEVDTNKTDSETPPEVTQYTFNVRELIERQLNNPQIFEQSHFGAAIDNQNRIEAHHGDAWKGSITTSLDLYPMKTEEADPKLQSHKYPGGCYLVDCCDTDDNLREVLVRAIGLFRKSEEAYEDIIAYVQPIIRSVEDLQLFGLMKYADLFDFSKITRKHIPDSEIPGTRASDADLTDEEQEKASDITVSNCYLLKQSFRINANRFKEAVCVEIDRSSDDLDDVLPRLKIIRRGDRLPTKGDYDKGIVDEDGSVKRQRRSQASTRGGGTSRGKAGRLLKQKSRPTGANGRSANNIQKPMAPPNSQQCASHTCEGEENGEEFEDYASASPDQLQASMNEKLIHANTVTITPRNDGIPSHIIRQLIIPETDNTKFDRNLFLRGLPVPKQLSTTIKSNVTTKKKKKLERAAKKLKTLSAVQLNDFESRLGRKKTAIGRLRPTPNITMDRLIAAGHLRKTTAELEIESGEIVLDELSNDKSLPKLGVVIDLYSDKFGVFRTAHRTTGGIYMTILNLNHRGRDQCRNHTLCGFIPHGAKFSETGQTMMGQLKELAKGVIMNINGVQTKASQPAPVFVKLLTISGDMEEANAISGVNSATSRTGCRFCYMPSCSFDDTQLLKKEWERAVLQRQTHLCERIRKRAYEDTNNKGNINADLMLEAGILAHIPIVTTHGPAFDRGIQLPFILKEMEQRMQPSTELFEKGVIKAYRDMYPDEDFTHVKLMGYVIEVYSAIAKANKKIFARVMVKDETDWTRDDFDELEKSIFESRRMLDELYAPLDKTSPTLKMSVLASRIDIMREPRFPDIFFGAPIPFKTAKDEIKYPTVLLGRKEHDPVIEGKITPICAGTGLQIAYESYKIPAYELDLTTSETVYSKTGKASIKLARLQWWESISYYDTISEARSRVRIGDFVSVDTVAKSARAAAEQKDQDENGDTEGKMNNMHAKVLGICTHFCKGKNYVFFYVQWMKTQNRLKDRKMGNTEVYDLKPITEEDEQNWRNFVALVSVSASKPPYFIPFETKRKRVQDETGLELNQNNTIGKDVTYWWPGMAVRFDRKREAYYLNDWFFDSV